jgi:SMI1-KNR4 cell-wall
MPNHQLHPKTGIARENIREIEQKLNVQLPDDLVKFYQKTNGMEADEDIFSIIPLELVEKETDEIGEYLTFAEYLIYSEICGLRIDKKDRNKYCFFVNRLKNGVEQRTKIADSVEQFRKIFEEKGTFGIFK